MKRECRNKRGERRESSKLISAQYVKNFIRISRCIRRRTRFRLTIPLFPRREIETFTHLTFTDWDWTLSPEKYYAYVTWRPMKIKNWIGHKLHWIVPFFQRRRRRRRRRKEKRILCTKGWKKEISRHWQIPMACLFRSLNRKREHARCTSNECTRCIPALDRLVVKSE